MNPLPLLILALALISLPSCATTFRDSRAAYLQILVDAAMRAGEQAAHDVIKAEGYGKK